ncbi:hypothetical protein ABZ352_29560, partial [Streptomyces griseofuscus]
ARSSALVRLLLGATPEEVAPLLDTGDGTSGAAREGAGTGTPRVPGPTGASRRMPYGARSIALGEREW